MELHCQISIKYVHSSTLKGKASHSKSKYPRVFPSVAADEMGQNKIMEGEGQGTSNNGGIGFQ